MLKLLFLCVLFVLGSYMASLWIESYRRPTYKRDDMSILEGVDIKVFGKEGTEWRIEGSRAKIEKSTVILEQAKLQSKDTVLSADRAFIDRITGEGFLEGNIRLYTNEGSLTTERAEIKLREGIAHGDGDIVLRSEDHLIEGKGWSMQIKPLRVIIKKAKTEIR